MKRDVSFMERHFGIRKRTGKEWRVWLVEEEWPCVAVFVVFAVLGYVVGYGMGRG